MAKMATPQHFLGSVILVFIIFTIDQVTQSAALSCNRQMKTREFLPAENK